MLLTVCHREKMTIKARHIEKLSIYLLKDPSESFILALDTSIKAAIPKITVVTLITAMDTILITSEFYEEVPEISDF
jgi:hypothetical protein